MAAVPNNFPHVGPGLPGTFDNLIAPLALCAKPRFASCKLQVRPRRQYSGSVMHEGLGEACQDKRPWAGLDSRVWASALGPGGARTVSRTGREIQNSNIPWMFGELMSVPGLNALTRKCHGGIQLPMILMISKDRGKWAAWPQLKMGRKPGSCQDDCEGFCGSRRKSDSWQSALSSAFSCCWGEWFLQINMQRQNLFQS